MRDKCFDEGVIQAFFDGELTSDASENVARHVALCDDCAILLAEAEDETAFAFSALESELNTLVPTQRLWSKINDSIEKKEQTFWHKIYLFISNPTSIAFASMLIVFGVFIGILNWQSNAPENKDTQIAQKSEPKQNIISVASKTETKNAQTPQIDELPEVKTAVAQPEKREYQVVKTNLTKPEQNSKIKKQPIFQPAPDITDRNPTFSSANLIGEDSYLKTIATLEKTVNNRKDEVLKPSSRFAFEKDLAVVDDAITKMTAEVKRNPKNEAAKDVLRASYQNKIDLLSSVTEKTELMASLK